MIQVFTTYNNEEEILKSIALGEKKGLEWIYSNCFSTTEKMVLKFGGNYDEAWDIFQDAVTIFFEKCSKEGIELNCRISTYITSITKNLWIKKMSSLKNIRTIDEEKDDIAESSNDVDTYLQKEKDLTLLDGALELLGDPCKKLIIAFYYNKKSMQEICTEFGYTNADNVKTQKYKCLTRLKKIFFNNVSS